jgi:hypothetical protein
VPGSRDAPGAREQLVLLLKMQALNKKAVRPEEFDKMN